jgi:hypothetical protein
MPDDFQPPYQDGDPNSVFSSGLGPPAVNTSAFNVLPGANLDGNDPGGAPQPPGAVAAQYQLGPNFDTQWKLFTRYQFFEGVALLPVAAPPATPPVPPVIAQLHAPYTLRVVKWTAERFGAWPICPHWDQGTKEVLKYKDIIVAGPLLDPKGRYVYRVSGVYIYLHAVPLDDNAAMPAGTMPFDPGGGVYLLDPATFSRTILKPSA